MLKTVVIFFAIVIGGMAYFQQTLQNGTVLRYLHDHSEEKWVPASSYYIGEGYYLLQNLQEASTYFLNVAQRYPNHPIADDAYFSYLQCLDDAAIAPRAELVAGYQAYLEKYPNGKHAELVQIRYDNYRTSSR